MKPVLLISIPVLAEYRANFEHHFDLIYAPDAESRAKATDRLAEVDIVLTNGTTGYTAAQIDATPRLRLLCSLGVGYEKIDVEHARQRGIVVTNGAGTNASAVADHAMALLLAALRRIPTHDRATREGVWRVGLPLDPGLSGKNVGILGFGFIGEQIARRATGFECAVAYHARRKREASPFQYFDSALTLAAWSDCLICAAPGGPETHHMVNAEVLAALGPKGFLVNIGRGSIVDTEALATALRSGVIAGAGLDVYESEPKPPEPLIALENVVLTPHIAGHSPEAVRASIDLFFENAQRFLKGQSVLTPV